MSQEAKLKNGVWKLIALGALILAVTMGLYFYKFAPGYMFELSSEQQNWNNFGTFVGGIAGPCFGFMAFYAAVQTILMQGRQIDQQDRQIAFAQSQANLARQQAMSDDLQRLLTPLADRVDRHLAQVTGPYYGKKQSVRDWIVELTRMQQAGTDVGPQHNAIVKLLAAAGQNAEVSQRIEALMPEHLDPLLTELEAMGWCLSHHHKIGGHSTDLQEYYRYRYASVVEHLSVLGLFSEDSTVPDQLGDVAHKRYQPAPPTDTNGPEATA